MENQAIKHSLIFQLMVILQFVLVLLDLACVANAEDATSIPEKGSEVNSWFESTIKPLSERKNSLERDLVEAEGSVEEIKVRQDGSGKFKTITEALQAINTGNKKRIIISIGPGEYKDKIKVERFKPYITFLGDSNNRPVLTFDGNAAKYGTVDSASLIIESDYFVGANLIVKNTAPRPDGKMKDAQAAAIRISGDMAAFYNCNFTGFQDTLCDDKGRHFFKDCYIEGTVDFIFGEGKSLYLNTELHVVPGDPIAVIAAHARKNQDGVGGYSFVHCKVTGTDKNALLGRAWMEAARTVYAYCHMGDVIKPEGWSDFNKAEYQKTAYLGEYKNEGPGADTKGRVPYAKQLTDEEAKTFITLDYIDAAKWLLPPPKLSSGARKLI